MKQKVIELNGTVMSKPQGFVYNNTTYLPLFYLQTVLTNLGFNNPWVGSAHTWKITTPSWVKPNLSNINAGKGPVSIYINGTVVQTMDTLAAVDPSSHAPTTFVPVWYLQQVMKRLGVDYSWNGTVWNVKTSLNAQSNSIEDITKHMDTVLTNLSANSDLVQLTTQLLNDGYVTSHYLDEVKQEPPWSDTVSKYGVSKMELVLFHLVTQGNPTDTQVTVPFNDVSKVTYTDGTWLYQSAVANATLVKDAATGIWQVDDVQYVDPSGSTSTGSTGTTSGSTGTSAASGTATTK